MLDFPRRALSTAAHIVVSYAASKTKIANSSQWADGISVYATGRAEQNAWETNGRGSFVASATSTAQNINLVWFQLSKMFCNRVEAGTGTQRVAVLHFP